ncbi:MAG: DUF2269 domain-containing protein [Pseudomonadota bacterium]
MEYLSLKWIHILSAFLLFGTGLGSAFYKFMADRSGDTRTIAIVMGHVVLADWIFTTPTILIQPISGFRLAYLAGYSFTSGWLAAALILYIIAGACWVPVVYLQIRMRNLAEKAAALAQPLPKEYHRTARLWFWLGVPAFISMIAVLYLMVFKPF